MLLPAMDMLELERYTTPSNKIRIVTITDNQTLTTVAYEGIYDSVYGRRLAVVGVQWSITFIQDLFINSTKTTDWAFCYQVRTSTVKKKSRTFFFQQSLRRITFISLIISDRQNN